VVRREHIFNMEHWPPGSHVQTPLDLKGECDQN